MEHAVARGCGALDAGLVEDVPAHRRDAFRNIVSAADERDDIVAVRAKGGDEMAAQKARGTRDEIATHGAFVVARPALAKDYGEA